MPCVRLPYSCSRYIHFHHHCPVVLVVESLKLGKSDLYLMEIRLVKQLASYTTKSTYMCMKFYFGLANSIQIGGFPNFHFICSRFDTTASVHSHTFYFKFRYILISFPRLRKRHNPKLVVTFARKSKKTWFELRDTVVFARMVYVCCVQISNI